MYSPAETEKLIQTITERVVHNILGALSPALTMVADATTQSIFWQNKLLTEGDAARFFQQGIATIQISSQTLVTPLAQDFLLSKKMTLEHKATIAELEPPSNRSIAGNTIALITGSCSRTEVETIKSVLAGHKYDVLENRLTRGFTSELRRATTQVCRQIQNEEIRAGIVIDEAAFQLKRQAEKYEGIRSAMCWDIACANAGEESGNANMIFINNRLLGFKKLEKLIRIWALSLN